MTRKIMYHSQLALRSIWFLESQCNIHTEICHGQSKAQAWKTAPDSRQSVLLLSTVERKQDSFKLHQVWQSRWVSLDDCAQLSESLLTVHDVRVLCRVLTHTLCAGQHSGYAAITLANLTATRYITASFRRIWINLRYFSLSHLNQFIVIS